MKGKILPLIAVFALESCSSKPPVILFESFVKSGSHCSEELFLKAVAVNMGEVGFAVDRSLLERELNDIAQMMLAHSDELMVGCQWRVQVNYPVQGTDGISFGADFFAKYIDGETPLMCVNRVSLNTSYGQFSLNPVYPTNDGDNFRSGKRFSSPCFNKESERVRYL